MGTGSCANSAQILPRVPGLEGTAVRIVLPGRRALLLHQALAALAHAIHGVRYEEQTGVSKAVFEGLLGELQEWVDACEYDADGIIIVRDALGSSVGTFEAEFEPIKIRALRNSLEIAMLELGQDEFDTITGFSLGEGKQLLDVLNAALLDPLHLNRETDSVSH